MRIRKTTEWTRGQISSLPTWQNVALWTLQVLTAAFFLMSGISKLTSTPDMIALFEAVGIGQWLRITTGILEVLGAALLLVPNLAGLGASILMIVLLGAVFTHLFVIGGSPALPLILLAVACVLAWNRREGVITIWRRGDTRH